MMPHVDGVELCRRVRGLEHGAQNYLILLTGRDSSQDLVVGLESGADDYVTKPFEPVELRARLNVGLRLLEAQRQLADEVRQRVALQTAGAAAHELGQPLQVLLGNIGIVLEETNPDAPLHNSLTDMRSAVSRIAEIVKQMGTMRQVETKRYANRSDIIDFEGSAE
jgi:CheY-like chemotaxis protein